MDLIPSDIKDLGVIRRAVFASMYLPQECPNYWSLVSEFATSNSSKIDHITMKAIIENLQLLNAKAFSSESELTEEIQKLQIRDQPLGIVLVSSNDKCGICHEELLIRKDRPSHVVVYTELYGTVAGTHYHKYCKNKRCSFRQYFGYHSEGEQSVTFYDSNWAQLPYFISSNETAFDIKMIAKFDGELLLGQISYNQKAEIYNYCNNYEVEPKKCSFLDPPQANERFVVVFLFTTSSYNRPRVSLFIELDYWSEWTW
jgi:hypothetical protein